MGYMRDANGRRLDTFEVAEAKANSMFGLSVPIAPHVAMGLDTGFFSHTSNPIMVALKHRIYWPSSDLRIVVGPGNLASDVDASYAHLYAASLLVGGVRYPVTFRGRKQVVVDPGGYAVSDPLPVEVAMSAAEDIYSYLYCTAPLGTGRTLAAYRNDTVGTTNASNVVTDTAITAGDYGRPVTGTGIPTNSYVGTVTPGASFLLSSTSGSQTNVNATATGTVSAALGYKAGDTTLNLSAAPDAAFTATLPHTMSVNSAGGASEEAVTVTAVSGSTLTTSVLVKTTQPVGAIVSQKAINNQWAFCAEGDGYEAPGGDKTVTGTVPTYASTTTTLQAAATAGDTTIKLNAKLYGTSYTLGAETLTVRSVTGTSAPYTAYLTAPLASGYASGATVTAPNYGSVVAPIAILADKTDAPVPVVVLGDSIVTGAGYNTRNATSFATLALDGQRPYFALGKSSETLQTFLSTNSSKRRRNYLGTAQGGWVISEYGRNDISAGRTLAQLQADTATLIALVHRRGAKLALCTITPQTTSSDDHQTTVNQTVTSAGQEAVRVAYNTWLRAGSSGADLIFDTAAAAESSLNSGKWKADASGPYTADGTHPTKPGHELMAAAINPALLT